MKQKGNFYMGIQAPTENGEFVRIENQYGPVRSTLLITCMLTGGVVLGRIAGEYVDRGIKFIKRKHYEHKIKKEPESN